MSTWLKVLSLRSPVEEAAVVEVDPRPAADEARDIDVDDIRATKRESAKLVEHQLAPLPADRYCEACMCSKMQQVRPYTGASNRSLTKLGHIITLDHFVAPGDSVSMGATANIGALTVKDLWYGTIACYPMLDKSADDVHVG